MYPVVTFATVMGRHMPDEHPPPRQLWPQAPQLLGSVARFRQTPLQIAAGAEHAHCVPPQTSLVGQPLPHVPQFWVVVVSVHVLPQHPTPEPLHVLAALHVVPHAPALHAWPAGQVLQAPPLVPQAL
jgi:hypothetical protein